MKHKRKFSWFRLLLVIIIAYFGYVSFNQQVHLNTIDREQEIASSRLSEAERIHNELVVEKDKLNQVNYIEKIAREDLGLVKPGELPYISSNKS
ncbi:MAG: cell division protein FtsB [Massilibacillus sp.]|jgi:cell division protein FtsB|nr:cell division protein FtsB [Massilibacillus sp.]